MSNWFIAEIRWAYHGQWEDWRVAASDETAGNGDFWQAFERQRAAQCGEFLYQWDGDERGAIEHALQHFVSKHEIKLAEVDWGFSRMAVHRIPFPTFRSLLTSTPTETRFSIPRTGVIADHLPWFDHEADDVIEKSQKIETRFYIDKFIDGYRCHELAAIFFEGEPVLVFQRAGRGGDDHYREWVISYRHLYAMFAYIQRVVRETEPTNKRNEPALDEVRADISFFYGDSTEDLVGDSWSM